jgi:hypothetical protein
VHEYLTRQIAGWPAYGTRFGILHIDAKPPDDYARLTSDATGETIQMAGRSIRVAGDGPAGFLDNLAVTPQQVELNGWTADVTQGKPIEKLLVFLDEQCVFAGLTHALRPDVVQAFGKPELVASGFDIRLPRSLIPAGSEGRLRLFAVLGERATELKRPQPPPAVAEAPPTTPRG